MGRVQVWAAAAACLALSLAASGAAAAAPSGVGGWVDGMRPVPAPSELAGVPLPVTLERSPGRPPQPEAWAADRGQRLVYDVSQPSLIAWPAPAGAAPTSGVPAPAVILVPGGGFEFLSMDNEGVRVAERLKASGVRVFILKYRTLDLPGGFDGFRRAVAATFADRALAGGGIDIYADTPLAVADAQAAIRAVRADAARLGVDPHRIVLAGFSAGARAVLSVVQADAPGARPDFAATVYGPNKTEPVPADAPPLFAALAADDRFFGGDGLGLIGAWRAANPSVELHLFASGGHGFASQPSGATSDGWFDAFARWLADVVVSPRPAAR